MEAKVEWRFYEELNDFLRPERRKLSFSCTFREAPTVKDAIESLGVPHCEVDMILVNGESQGFDYRVADGDRIAVYPMFEAFDVEGLSLVRPKPLRVTKFMVDANLGKLARYLRMVGFDSQFAGALSDGEIVAQARQEGRIVLTRDRGLLMRRELTHGLWVRSDKPRVQIREVIERLHLQRRLRLLEICMLCNTQLELADKEELRGGGKVPADIIATGTPVSRCRQCSRYYWQGSHYDRMREFCATLQS